MNHPIKGFNKWHLDNKVVPIGLYLQDMLEYNYRSNYEMLDFIMMNLIDVLVLYVLILLEHIKILMEILIK